MESYEDKIKLHNDLQKFQIEKSIVGSEAYNIEQDLMKGVSKEEILEKAKSGIYKPTKQNLKEGIAGQKYGSEKKEDDAKEKQGKFIKEIERDLWNNLGTSWSSYDEKDYSPYKILGVKSPTLEKYSETDYKIIYSDPDISKVDKKKYPKAYEQLQLISKRIDEIKKEGKKFGLKIEVGSSK